MRALGAVVLLLALVLGLPAALGWATLALAHRLGTAPGGGGLTGLLRAPDQGQILLAALAAVGWLCWLSFALSVLLELPAQLRGTARRRLPVPAWSRRAAAVLVGAALAALPAGGAFAATLAPAPPTTAVTAGAVAGTPVAGKANAARAQASSPVAGPVSARTDSAGLPTYTVRDARPADSLWGIAQRTLGDGARWQEIARLNQGRVMDAAGNRFDAELPIQPGWVLLLPGGARVAPDAGSGGSWATGVEAGAGAGAGGGATVHGAPGATADKGAPEHETADVTELRAPTGASPAAPTSAASASTASGSAASASAASGERSAPTPVLSATSAAQRANADSVADRLAQDAVLGIAGVLGAALAGQLLRARVLQQRRRQPGGRLRPLPPEGESLAAQLGFAADLEGLRLLDRVLRTLAATCLSTGAQLPEPVAVALHRRGRVDLLLRAPAGAADTAPLAPFTATADPLLWTCRADDPRLLPLDRARAVPAPYPALVTLGTTVHGVQVLADLETSRHVLLRGAPEQVAAVQRAWAVELAVSPLSDGVRVLGGPAGRLGPLGVDRLHPVAGLTQALSLMLRHGTAVARALEQCGVPAPRAARSGGVAVAAWTPAVLLHDQPLASGDRQALGRLLGRPDLHCLAAVTPAGPDAAPDAAPPDAAHGWLLDAAPGCRPLPGTPFRIELQRLTVPQLDALLATLGSAADTEASEARSGSHATEPGTVDADPFVIPVRGSRAATVTGPVGSPAEAAATAVPLIRLPAPAVLAPGRRHHPQLLFDEPYIPAQPAFPEPVGVLPGEPAPSSGAVTDAAASGVGQEEAAPAAAAGRAAGGSGEAARPVVAEQAEAAGAAEDTGDPVVLPEPSQLPPALRVLPRPQATPQAETGAGTRAGAGSPQASARARLVALPGGRGGGLRVEVLGPVRVVGAVGRPDWARTGQLIALAALVALHPDPPDRLVDLVVAPVPFYRPAPGRHRADVARLSRAAALDRLRAWLGTGPDGAPLLRHRPLVLSGTVTTDWEEFQQLQHSGLAATGPAADAALHRALALVQGPPLEGAYHLYPWAETERQDMISAIIDVAHELAVRRFRRGDWHGCEHALRAGLRAVPEAEILRRGLIRLYARTRRPERLQEAVRSLAAVNDRLGASAEPETYELLRRLSAGAA